MFIFGIHKTEFNKIYQRFKRLMNFIYIFTKLISLYLFIGSIIDLIFFMLKKIVIVEDSFH